MTRLGDWSPRDIADTYAAGSEVKPEWEDEPANDEQPDWNDCGSGRCDPNTGCPKCEERDFWVRRS